LDSFVDKSIVIKPFNLVALSVFQ